MVLDRWTQERRVPRRSLRGSRRVEARARIAALAETIETDAACEREHTGASVLGVKAIRAIRTTAPHGAEPISTPPMPAQARIDAGYLLRLVQKGQTLGPPIAAAMTDIGPSCHELRLSADNGEWRVFYHVAADVVLVLGVFHKKTQKTPPRWIEICRKRLRLFNES
ncbi:MAG: type II toxin-antitoxin system RelE/ParE family toxin [Thermoanaerobaculia bacterium]